MWSSGIPCMHAYPRQKSQRPCSCDRTASIPATPWPAVLPNRHAISAKPAHSNMPKPCKTRPSCQKKCQTVVIALNKKVFSGQCLAKAWRHSCHSTLSNGTFLGVLASSDRRQTSRRGLQANPSSPTLHPTWSALRALIRVRTNGKACAGGKEGNLVAQKHCRCGKERQTTRISDRMNSKDSFSDKWSHWRR
jgi:hypothetical protein